MFMFSRLCTGRELLDRILSRGGKYSEDDAKEVMVQILSVVSYCHLQGVVHRDLKPETLEGDFHLIFYILLQNFLFTSKDEHSPLKAIDFGLSDYVKPGHPWLANYHDVKIPLDMIIYKLVTAYICSSSLRKAALGVCYSTFDKLPVNENFAKELSTTDFVVIKPYNIDEIPPSQSQALAKSLTVPQLAYLREQFTLLGPNKSGYISLQNFKTAVAKNSMEAMKDSRVLDYAHMMSTLQYRKLDFEEFCAVAISVH
ncbi:hypothetical protein RHGRI_004934 [Rhododendron griersonianum]|uniref:Uncharacterized protein n=1 Tax=Rhododendron griersonianum TaxID=479676 RepID=A0AAV6LB81_9ERIC|nr:hypothetical protein RHGRI_004934 [Rhododendron griersonianum]